MELEIKGFIQFCKFLSKHPDLIINTADLPNLLIFCFDSVKNCDCSSKTASKRVEFEASFFKEMQKISPETLKKLGEAFDLEKTYEIINVSFPDRAEVIKLK